MLCPEVWKFAPPQSNYREQTGDFAKFPSELKDFHYAHLVSVVLPNIQTIADELIESLSSDCDYYKAEQISLAEFCSKEFIENFVRKGALSALSINTRIDTDNCVALTPDGVLVLSLNRKSYEELGLEGKVSHFSSSRKEKYIVHINLKHDQFTKNSKLYERTRQCLTRRLGKFTLILSWEPPEENVCPSSVAKYLAENGVKISLCSPTCDVRTKSRIKIPLLGDSKDFMGSEVVEWLGMFSLDCDLENDDEYMSAYEMPHNNVTMKRVTYLECRGFFTSKQIEKIYNTLLTYVSKPWTSMYVQGFSDSAVAWKLQENHFYTNSDNSYVLFLQATGKYLLCMQSTTNKKHK